MSKFNKPVISVFVEINLAAQPFLIAAVVYDSRGVEVARFLGRLPDPNIQYRQKVTADEARHIAELLAVPTKHADYEALLADFAKFYLANTAADMDVIAHFASGEDRVFDDMFKRGLVKHCPVVHDTIDGMNEVGELGTLDDYIKTHDLWHAEFSDTEVPLRKADAAAVVYRHMMRRLAGEQV